jgi:branched-chain amino acid transport system permease protein
MGAGHGHLSSKLLVDFEARCPAPLPHASATRRSSHPGCTETPESLYGFGRNRCTETSGIVTVAGLLLGLPALRLRGLYLALATIAFQYLVIYGLTQYETANDSPSGFQLPQATVGPFVLNSDKSWYIVLIIFLAITVAVCRFLRLGKPGRAWLAIRQHDIAASVVGVSVTRYKLLAFVVSAFITGMAGAMGASYVRAVSDGTYTLVLAISYIAMIIIGGLGSIYGPIVGAFIVTLLPEFLDVISGTISGSSSGNFLANNTSDVEMIVYGVLVLFVLVTEPRGVAGIVNRLRRSFNQRLGLTR